MNRENAETPKRRNEKQGVWIATMEWLVSDAVRDHLALVAANLAAGSGYSIEALRSNGRPRPDLAQLRYQYRQVLLATLDCRRTRESYEVRIATGDADRHWRPITEYGLAKLLGISHTFVMHAVRPTWRARRQAAMTQRDGRRDGEMRRKRRNAKRPKRGWGG